jgi:uncharacterized membrane protein YdjX (TVP38/TMEM64 family)
MQSKRVKQVLFAVWISLFAVLVFLHFRSGFSLQEYPDRVKAILAQAGVWGPIAYIVIYIFRPLLFFPATLLTAISGALFGPIGGIFYTMAGENLSANFTFMLGRYFMKDLAQQVMSRNATTRLMDCRFRENGFISVMIMRLIYLPFDLVGFMAGACDVRQVQFAAGTFLGIIPGMVSFVLLGSAITDPINLLLALLFLLFGVGLSRFFKRWGLHSDHLSGSQS